MSAGALSPPLPTEAPTAGGHEFDDLLNYDAGDVNDPFSENYINEARKSNEAKDIAERAEPRDHLGVDQQLDIPRKPRAPRVKLDEERLLSESGIKKLRQTAKKHLKFRGRGHEFSDMANLLSFYQLWLDDIFPKGKFLDSLALVEKMGHKKRIQVARQGWIDEGRPKPAHVDDVFDEPALPRREDGERERTVPRVAHIFEISGSGRPKTPAVEEDPNMDDLYDATPQARRYQSPAPAARNSLLGDGSSSFGPSRTHEQDDEDVPDELDALLAEDEAAQSHHKDLIRSGSAQSGAPVREDDFDDEMEALAEMSWEG